MEQGHDIENAMATTREVLTYSGIIGQAPWLHSWSIGYQTFVGILQCTGMLGDDPYLRIVNGGCFVESFGRGAENL